MRIVGIDPSLTNTGIAILQPGHDPQLALIRTTGRNTDTTTQRHRRMRHIVMTTLDHTGHPDLVVIEGMAYSRANAHAHEIAGLWWLITNALLANDYPLAVVGPSTLKRWATGKGNAGKIDVALALARLWPTSFPDGRTMDDNRVDALALATIGAQHTGLDVPTLTRHHEPRTKAEWPTTHTPTNHDSNHPAATLRVENHPTDVPIDQFLADRLSDPSSAEIRRRTRSAPSSART